MGNVNSHAESVRLRKHYIYTEEPRHRGENTTKLVLSLCSKDRYTFMQVCVSHIYVLRVSAPPTLCPLQPSGPVLTKQHSYTISGTLVSFQ